MDNGFGNLSRAIRVVIYNERASVLACFLFGFFAPFLYACVFNFPIPYAHDEFGYLLSADTFANGRLTNPTPPLWHHFESPHILLVPTYAGKYPPMQSLFLALGQVIFGSPAFGVWLSCAAAAAAVCWMLRGWLPPRWAFVGSLLAILYVGIETYWAQAFWGGMAAMCGGALFFGGFIRVYKRASTVAALWMTIGGIILANSRPFEGLLTMLPALCLLGFWLLKNKRRDFGWKANRIVLPSAILATIALAAMGYYNFRVTGNALRLPYVEHMRQYLPPPMFIFQSRNENANGGHERLQRFDNYWKRPPILAEIPAFGLPDKPELAPIYGFAWMLTYSTGFMLPFLVWLLVVPFSVFLFIKRRRLRLVIGTILFVFACESLATFWDQAHYLAPIACLFYLLLAETLRMIAVFVKQKAERRQQKILFVLLAVFLFCAKVPIKAITLPPPRPTITINDLKPGETQDATLGERACDSKEPIEKALEKLPQKDIIVVFYSEDFSLHDEIVYNRADLENAEVIWAHNLGEDNNRQLLEYFKDRRAWKLEISTDGLRLSPYPH
jgi:hypothetical protein